MDITNAKGRTFNVVIVRKGERYGLDKCLTHADPLVEFYDTSCANRFGFGPEGQFVSRYFLSTLRNHSGGLCLDGGNADVWTIDAGAMREVMEWLASEQTVRAVYDVYNASGDFTGSTSVPSEIAAYEDIFDESPDDCGRIREADGLLELTKGSITHFVKKREGQFAESHVSTRGPWSFKAKEN